MFKAFPPRIIIFVAVWLTIMLYAGLSALAPMLFEEPVPILGLVVAGVQFIFTLFFVTPLWRSVWRWVPQFNQWVYPDLNGEWDVELKFNWPRIDALMKAARGEGERLDYRTATETDMPPLGTMRLRARIKQSWLKMSMLMWNPDDSTPIRESNTRLIYPVRDEDGRHGIAYIFQQKSETDNVADDSSFRGAAWLVVDHSNPDILRGEMWTDRMWRHGMNTAGTVELTRRSN